MENYNERLQELTHKVNEITNNTIKVENKSFLSTVIPNNINLNYIIIGSVPLLTLILLLIIKPRFILKKDEDNIENKYKINIPLLFGIIIFTLIFAIIINYLYFYKKKL